MDKEFEEWLRSVCFQKPTPEAYDLDKDAYKLAKQHWLDKAMEIVEITPYDCNDCDVIAEAIKELK